MAEVHNYKHSYDIVFKWIATVFTGKTLDVLGIQSGKIVEVRGLEPITFKVKEERIDLLLKDDQNKYYHLEEQRNFSKKDIYRFAAQHFLVAEQIKTDDLISVIIASGEVTPQEKIETPSARYQPTIINLNHRDGEQKLAEMQKQQEPNPIELVFLPLYGVKGKDRKEFATEVLLYTKKLYKDKKIQLEFLGALLMICNKLVSKKLFNEVWEEIKMLQMFKYAEEIGMQKGEQIGMQKGEEKAMREMITTLLELKFGEEGALLLSKVKKITDFDQLSSLKELLKVSKDINTIKKFIQNPE